MYGKTQTKARAKLKELQAKIDASLPITSCKGITLGRWLTEEWMSKILPRRVKTEKISQSTNSYADITMTARLGSPCLRMIQRSTDTGLFIG